MAGASADNRRRRGARSAQLASYPLRSSTRRPCRTEPRRGM